MNDVEKFWLHVGLIIGISTALIIAIIIYAWQELT